MSKILKKFIHLHLVDTIYKTQFHAQFHNFAHTSSDVLASPPLAGLIMNI